MTDLIYLFVVFFATLIGASTGVGGGAIIKPIFDVLSYDTAVIIGIYSAIAVFTMCLTSLYRQYKSKAQVSVPIMIGLSLGSVVGGYLGELVFKAATSSLSNARVKAWQAGIMVLVLVFTIFYNLNKYRLPRFQVKSPVLAGLVGLVIGIVSIFLGIGGGPLNIAALLIFFSYEAKSAAIYSLAMIFCGQLPKILLILGQWQSYQLNPVFVTGLVLTAVLGGFVGTAINRRLAVKQVEILFLTLTICLIVISLYNLFTNQF